MIQFFTVLYLVVGLAVVSLLVGCVHVYVLELINNKFWKSVASIFMVVSWIALAIVSKV